MTTHDCISLTRRRILVVDDHADAAEGLALLLKLHGHETVTAENGLTAIDLARSFRPDVVLLDIGLPGMNGYEVAQHLRDEHTDALLLVALTGYSKEEDRRRASAAGFDHLLVKPICVESLESLLAAPRARRQTESNVH